MSSQSLLGELQKHLPLRVYGNGPVVELLREMGCYANKKSPLTVTSAVRDTESGEIVCQMKFEDKEKFTVALANLKLDITHPLYRKVKNYRDEVANELAKPDQSINRSSFRVGDLYKKK